MSSNEPTRPEEKASLAGDWLAGHGGSTAGFQRSWCIPQDLIDRVPGLGGHGRRRIVILGLRPDESFRSLLEHGNTTYLAVFMALATALTVFVMSYAYSRIIEHFQPAAVGYVVASKLLGEKAGLLSGSAAAGGLHPDHHGFHRIGR